MMVFGFILEFVSWVDSGSGEELKAGMNARTASQRMRRPCMTLMRMTMTATTSRMWINPPIVELVTKPSSHKTMRMIAMVVNMISVGSVDVDCQGFCG